MTNLLSIANNILTSKVKLAYSSTPQFNSNVIFEIKQEQLMLVTCMSIACDVHSMNNVIAIVYLYDHTYSRNRTAVCRTSVCIGAC